MYFIFIASVFVVYETILRLADTNKQVYEKTPTYYRTPKIAKRIHDMNSTIKLIYVGTYTVKSLLVVLTSTVVSSTNLVRPNNNVV